MQKLSDNMTRTLIGLAERGRTIVWGREAVTIRALEKRGLVVIQGGVVRNGGVAGDHNRTGLRAEVTDAGYELAVELA